LSGRHGARLDAADRNWHLSSPAPYDPPLTYGGWNQSKALGSRIATILHARETSSDPNGNSSKAGLPGLENIHSGNAAQSKKRKRKQKVIIHSSPFLRCLQTSVAIGAGIAQSIERQEDQKVSVRSPNGERIPETNDVHPVKTHGDVSEDEDDIKTTIRVDAFLGEWLSPDYFDHITPPPNSTMMVAGAKANLLRREHIQVFQPTTTGNGYFPGGWSKTREVRNNLEPSTSAIAEDEGASMQLLSPTRSNPHRANSVSGGRSSASRVGHMALPIESSVTKSKSLYNPPIPAYAVKPSDPIPRGYCVHARDAAIDLDLNWDSMRQPQDWGDGGDYGEEWSSMHRRFRTGLSKMISWYKQHPPSFHPDKEDPLALKHDEHDDDDDDDDLDEEYELVIILVTHSAGCNALIGGLTNHPVLLNFGLSSLSMAVRKELDDAHTIPLKGRRRSSVDFGLSDEYEVKIMASVGHLRAGAEAAKVTVLQSPHLVPQIPEFRLTDSMLTLQKASTFGPATTEGRRNISSALGSMRRSSLTPSASNRNSSRSPSRSATSRSGSSSGLWSKTPTTTSSVDDIIQDLSIGSPVERRPESSDSDAPLPIEFQKVFGQRVDELTPLPRALGRAMTQHGLWGSQPSGKGAEPQFTHKRRWTMSEPEPDED
jgi:hypothetical protein